LKQNRNFFFIDGLHTDIGIQEDVKILQEFGKKGDAVVFHDLHLVPIKQAFDRLKIQATRYEVWSNPYPRRGGYAERDMGVVIL
jgi:hypothetical protein